MPNYIYKCTECDHEYMQQLPMSFDPKIKLACRHSHDGTEFTMTRRIGKAIFPEKVGKVFAGDWFKKTYGHDMSEVAKGRAREKVEYDAEKLKLEKDGVRITHRSRQVGGKDRISVPDKDGN